MNPEVTYAGSFLPKGGGALLRVGIDGSWTILSSCSASSNQQCDGAVASVANGTGLSIAPSKWARVSLALTPGAAGLKIAASIDGKTLMDKTVACRQCHYGGPAYLGTGFHHASWDNFKVTPSKSDDELMEEASPATTETMFVASFFNHAIVRIDTITSPNSSGVSIVQGMPQVH